MSEFKKKSQAVNGKPRKINVAQRKALEKVIRERYVTLISQQEGVEQKTWEDIRKEALQTVKKQLGVDKIEAQIQALEEQKKALGFSFNYMPDHGSKAQELHNQILVKHRKKENTLREEMEEKIALIWTVESVDEAKHILGIEKSTLA